MGRAPTILLVEDEDSVRELLLSVLSYDYSVLAVRDGEGALTILQCYPGTIDLLLADAGLPDLDGWDLARRAADLRPRTRCVMMSGDVGGTFSQRRQYRFLAKPFQVSELHAVLAETLSPAPDQAGDGADRVFADSSPSDRIAAHSLE